MISYAIVCNEDHLIETMERRRSLTLNKYLLIILKIIGFIGMCALLAVCIYGKIWAVIPVPLIAIVLLLLGRRLDYWLFKRRYKRLPDYGLVANLSFTNDGILAVTSKSNVSLNWSYLTQVRRLSDGFLVFYGPYNYAWWPDHSITSGTVQEISEVLSANTIDYKIA